MRGISLYDRGNRRIHERGIYDMKLMTFQHNGVEKIGVVSNCGCMVYPIQCFGLTYQSMNELIEKMTEEEKKAVAKKLTGPMEGGISLSDTQKMAPIPKPKQDIICVGMNYVEHAEEAARFKESAFGGERPYPVYFAKRVNACTPDGGIIPRHEDIVDSLDYEVELGVIIGKQASHVSEEEAYKYVFGYTVVNDVSARSLQTRHKQWYFGKSLDGFFPMGPVIVTADEIEAPPALKITSKINGELRQNGRTDFLIFPIAHIISELSQGMTLEPGTIIATGTPVGVGMGFQPPKWLKSGDVVVCEIEKIGTLTSTVK